MRFKAGAAVVAVGAIWLASSCTLPVTDLGGALSTAFGVNDAGIVVGISALPDPGTPARAFKRLPDNTAVDLGTLTGGHGSVAWDINDAGTTVGESGSPNGNRVVLWDTANQITDLGFNARPRDLNDAGVFVGHSYVVPGRTKGHAFVYDPAVGHPVALPELAGGTESSAWGLNDAGQAVGRVEVPEPGGSKVDVPVLWDLAAGTVTDLRGWIGVAFTADIGDDGTIVGQSSDGRAVVWQLHLGPNWTPTSDHITYLTIGYARAISDEGTVIGSVDGHSFRWRAGTAVVPLGTSGVTNEAYAVSANGAAVVGSSGDKAAFLIDQDVR